MNKLLYSLLLAVALVIGLLAVPAATLTVLTFAGLCAVAVYVVANQRRSLRRSNLHGAVNTQPDNVGTHTNSRPYLADAALARWLLAKIGSDASHSAVCTASTVPIGVMTDSADAAEDLVDVELLGVSNRTMKMVAGGAIAAGADVYTAAAGKVTALSAVAATYYKVGVALTAAGADGDTIEVQHCTPVAKVVT